MGKGGGAKKQPQASHLLVRFSSLSSQVLLVVLGGRNVTALARPVGVVPLARLVHELVGVRTEVVTLGLQQVGRKPGGAVAVPEGEGRRQRRGRDAGLHDGGHNLAPRALALADLRLEPLVAEERLEAGVRLEGLLDLAQEGAPDDASTTPHQRDAAVVQRPAVLLSRSAEQHVALRVRHDLRRQQRLTELLDELLLVALERLRRHRLQGLRGTHTLVLQRREAAREHGLADEGEGHTQLQGFNARPLARALLAGAVADLLNQGLAVLLVLQDVTGDLDQVRLKVALVELGEDLRHLVARHAEHVAHDVVHLAHHLHVAVLDAVVHHLHVVTGTVLAHPVAARLVVHLRADRLEDRAHRRPRVLRTTRHDRRAVPGALLATADAGTDEEQAALGERLRAADRVGEVGVASVDDDVAHLEVRDELVDEVVDGLAGLHHEHDLAGALQAAAHVLRRRGAHDVCDTLRGAVVHELVDLVLRAVPGNHLVAVVGHVQDQVLAHHGHTDEGNVAVRVVRAASLRAQLNALALGLLERVGKRLPDVGGGADLVRGADEHVIDDGVQVVLLVEGLHLAFVVRHCVGRVCCVPMKYRYCSFY
eukprot:Rhum_TRINITY_DN286_c0_g1::Rhum_TRINITY_DN286_c0_g1_i1::g.658::m.658